MDRFKDICEDLEDVKCQMETDITNRHIEERIDSAMEGIKNIASLIQLALQRIE